MAAFKQAKKWLREGEKICRTSWKPRTFWILGIDENILCSHNDSDILKIPHIHLNQLEADDWEIYDEGENINQLKHRIKKLEKVCEILSDKNVKKLLNDGRINK